MRKLQLSVLVPVLAALAVSGCANTPRTIEPAEVRGGVMTDWYEHRTLYTFDRDSTNPTRSVCTTAYCEMNWPPFRPTAGERARGDYTIINRDDGTSQWAYKGKPLYFFSKDTKTGERLGNDVNGVWHVVN